MSHLNISILVFSSNFVLLKVTCLVTLFDRKHELFKNSPNWTIFGIFNELLSTQNVNVAYFARNVESDFFCDFRTPCSLEILMRKINKIFRQGNLEKKWLQDNHLLTVTIDKNFFQEKKLLTFLPFFFTLFLRAAFRKAIHEN